MGKVIYKPSGKAGEYSYWAANFYNGCSGDCSYCYMRKGPIASNWSNTPKLKKTLVDVRKAKKIFRVELENNIPSLKENGLFFNFNSDPFLKETINLNLWAMKICDAQAIPVKALTKQVWWENDRSNIIPQNVCPGFTLTGHNELEPGASDNEERIDAMCRLHHEGFKTWASIEPIIDIESSLKMIEMTNDFCYLYKIGPMSGKKYDPNDLHRMFETVSQMKGDFKVYWKDDFFVKAGINSAMANVPHRVGRNYKLWEAASS